MINPLLPSNIFFQKSPVSVTQLRAEMQKDAGIQARWDEMVAVKQADDHDISALRKALRDGVVDGSEIRISKRQLWRILHRDGPISTTRISQVATLVDTIWGKVSLWQKVWFPRDG